MIQLLGPNRLSLALKSSDPAFIGVRAIDPAVKQALGEAQLMPAANTLIGEMFETGQTALFT